MISFQIGLHQAYLEALVETVWRACLSHDAKAWKMWFATWHMIPSSTDSRRQTCCLSHWCILFSRH